MRRYVLAALAVSIVGCSDEETAASDPACRQAQAPYGIEPSQDSLPDIELLDCAGSKVNLRPLRCETTLTLVNVGAGWCAPCREETPELAAADVALPDVSVIQTLFEDAAGNPATTLFCEGWREEFDLDFPVLIDPAATLTGYFDVAETPLNVVIDRNGAVVWSETGKPSDIQEVLIDLLDAAR